MSRVIVQTQAAPAAIGPYSQAVRSGELLFTSGQIPLDPSTGQLVGGDASEQTERVMQNLEAVLAAAGAGFADVLRSTIYLVDLADFGTVNEVYGRRFPGEPPARSTVQVAALPRGARVEIDLVARIPGGAS
ncbi:MAG: RidA family protein [Polyangiaceae bacterium]|nr:RidA family protein [Polyangiaceae bacterium]